MRTRTIALGVAGLVAVAALAPMARADVPAATPVLPGSAEAYYSPRATLPMAQSPQGLRHFLSHDQPQYDEQSYVWAGSLIEADGSVNALAVEMQRNDSLGGLVAIPAVSAGILVNREADPGYVIGGLGGIPDLTIPLALTSVPWSARAQSFTPGQQPDFVDVRVVEGQIGERGAVYEFSADVPDIADGPNKGRRMQVYVRAVDTTGVMQWGYGPSGFMPMWIYPPQRAAIMDTYDGSVGDYLAATRDRMASQGTYYFSSPLLKVQDFRVAIDGRRVSHGSDGWLWMDNVERSFDQRAQDVVDNGVSWLEFSVQVPKTRQALKIGYTEQASVGRFPYAMLSAGDAPTARNGARTSQMTWNIDGIRFHPVPGSKWTNPATGHTYYLKYRVNLDDSGTGKKSTLWFTAALPKQEAVISSRSVFEGLFRMKGTIDGKPVEGWGFGELQPVGSLSTGSQPE